MKLWELLLVAFGLAMDAFAAAVCKGLAMKTLTLRGICAVGVWFGIFQGLMPFLGSLLGSTFAGYIESLDHWISFFLLSVIGLNMLKEAFETPKRPESSEESLRVRVMLPLAIATSIDAFAAGVTFAFLLDGMKALLFAVALIAAVTFVLSSLGVFFGHLFGEKYQKKAELFGGIALILLGVKILVEHLFLFR